MKVLCFTAAVTVDMYVLLVQYNKPEVLGWLRGNNHTNFAASE